MHEYRCTRDYPYNTPGCPGHINPKARQGYYIRAANVSAALAQMAVTFSEDTVKGYWFTADLWKENVRP